jgi:hypothetical protein
MAANRRLKHRASRQPSIVRLNVFFRERLLSAVVDDGHVQGTKRISYGREKGYGILIRPATVLPVENATTIKNSRVDLRSQ